MNKLTLIAVAVSAFILTGCSNMPAIARALSKDPAFVSVQVRTIYGTATLVRDGRPQSGNLVTPEGTVTSTPGTNVIQPVVQITPETLDRINAAAIARAKQQIEAAKEKAEKEAAPK